MFEVVGWRWIESQADDAPRVGRIDVAEPRESRLARVKRIDLRGQRAIRLAPADAVGEPIGGVDVRGDAGHHTTFR